MNAEFNWIRVGFISSIDHAKGLAEVAFDDRAKEDLVSFPCQMLVPWSSVNKVSTPYDVGEQVVCLFLPNGQAAGFILGSANSASDPLPDEGSYGTGIYSWKFGESVYIKLDRNTGQVDIKAIGDVNISTTGNVNIKAENISLNE
jgi:phage baseplate assembly protein gpV